MGENKFSYVGTAVLFIVAILCYALGFSVGLTILMAIISIVLVFIFDSKVAKRRVEAARKNNQYISLESNGIYLKSRCAGTTAMLKWKPIEMIGTKYHPAEAVYTGATSGGITMGSVTYFDEFYETKKAGQINKYEVFISVIDEFGDTKDRQVEELILDESMIASAKKTPIIRNFLEGNILRLQHKNERTDAELSLWASSSYDKQVAMQNVWRSRFALSAEEVSAFKAWLGGDDLH